MNPLTDRGILWRTFPLIPRKRVRLDPEMPVEFCLFERPEIVFRCKGGYFTHNSYNLLDWFVSRWREIAAKQWMTKFGENYPSKFQPKQLEDLCKITPILRRSREEMLELKNSLPELARHFQEYVLTPEISDREMREHCSLHRLSSRELHEVIERTARCMIKTIYPVRTLDHSPSKKSLQWLYLSNLGEKDPWSNLFGYRLIEEKHGKDGRVTERIYRFSFMSLLGILMIHNSICGASWKVNSKLYEVSPDAQLLYRYLVVAGSRIWRNRVDYISHRLGWRERQKRRLATALEPYFQELKDSALIGGFEMTSHKRGNYFLSLDVKNGKWRPYKGGKKGYPRIKFNPGRIGLNPEENGLNPKS